MALMSMRTNAHNWASNNNNSNARIRRTGRWNSKERRKIISLLFLVSPFEGFASVAMAHLSQWDHGMCRRWREEGGREVQGVDCCRGGGKDVRMMVSNREAATV